MALQQINTTDIATGGALGSIGANNITATYLQTGAVETALTNNGTSFGFKNRIINGAMMVDQRNAGASVTGNDNYSADRFKLSLNGTGNLSGQQVTDAPVGFAYSSKISVATADSSLTTNEFYNLRHAVEGYNISDLGWGNTGAQSVTLSFWVKSSVIGSYVVRFINAGGTTSYPVYYNINSVNTWEYKTITIPGPTSGSWDKAIGVGLELTFQFGSGPTYTGATPNTWNTVSAYQNSAFNGTNNFLATNGATWQITGVQLEKGSTATAFEFRSIGQELALCQRYFYRIDNTGATNVNAVGVGSMLSVFSSTRAFGIFKTAVPMRTNPTMTYANMNVFTGGFAANPTVTGIGVYAPAGTSSTDFYVEVDAASGFTGICFPYLVGSTNAYLNYSAEL
jgi:hypothetical protein